MCSWRTWAIIAHGPDLLRASPGHPTAREGIRQDGRDPARPWRPVVRRRDLSEGRRQMAYLYRAVDQHGQVIDVLLSARRDLAAARHFFARGTGGRPRRCRAATYGRAA